MEIGLGNAWYRVFLTFIWSHSVFTELCLSKLPVPSVLSGFK